MARYGGFFWTTGTFADEPGHKCELDARQHFETICWAMRAAEALVDLQDAIPGIPEEHCEKVRAEFRRRRARAFDDMRARLEALEPNLDRVLSMH